MLGLLAAAGFPLSLEDLSRLTGRNRSQLSELLPAESVPGIHVDERGFLVADTDAVARVVRGLYRGPMAPGGEYRGPTREQALTPFRRALDAAAESARTEWGWQRAMPFLLGADYPRSLQQHGSRRRLLIAMLCDPARVRVLAAIHPDAAQEQFDEATQWLARTATSTADLVDLAVLLIAAARSRPRDGAPPHGLPSLWAYTGDLERARRLAEAVRVEPDIELAYVGEAAARAGMAEGAILAREAAEQTLARDAPDGALIRVAQALAGTALHTAEPSSARGLASLARQLVTEAFAGPEQIPEVARLSQKIFSGARDHERSVSASTLATAAAALARAGDDEGARGALEQARSLAEQIVPADHRALTLARIAARLRVESTLDDASEAVADDALAVAGSDAAVLAGVARRLAGRGPATAPDPDLPAPGDTVRAQSAARGALAQIVRQDDVPPRGALREAAGALGEITADGPAVLAARAVLERITSARYATPLERGTRARVDAVVTAEAAAVLDAAGLIEEAEHAGHAALELTARIPVAARARPLADIAAALMGTDGPLFDLALRAADAEHRGTSSYWDPEATEAVAAGACDGLTAGAAGAPRLSEVLEQSVLAMRRHEYTGGIVRVADRLARAGDLERTARLARDALVSSHTPDPVIRVRARDALDLLDAAETPELVLRQTARRWVADGYPLRDLAALRAADPVAGARVVKLVRSDLARQPGQTRRPG